MLYTMPLVKQIPGMESQLKDEQEQKHTPAKQQLIHHPEMLTIIMRVLTFCNSVAH